MKRTDSDFRDRSRLLLEREPDTRESVTRAALGFDRNRRRAFAEVDGDRWRAWAEEVKSHLLTNLDRYLEEAEERLTANGALVHWAETAEDARSILDALVTEHGVQRAVKGKSMLSEELGVNEALEACSVEVFETDLGERIIQLLEEPPSHIVAPAIHRSLDDVRRLFRRVYGTDVQAEPDALAAEARTSLRQAFLSAEMGITGGNFLVAETGTLALIENEGNIRLATSVPPVHVALVGIEKLLPRWSDLAGFLQLAARSATGQPTGTFVSLLQGPGRPGEPDGPDHVHVILVDNGRTRLLADPEAWEVLRCIRCGACLNTCPVYRQAGGHPYDWAYSGPIGAVLAPGLLGLAEGGGLAQASSLCGACAEACPVKIPIPELLLTWRRRSVEEGGAPTTERAGLRAYGGLSRRPALYGAAGSLLALLGRLPGSRRLPVIGGWNQVREAPTPSRKTFRRLWREGIE